MQVTMPKMAAVAPLKDISCKLLLVRNDAAGDHFTAIVGDEEVIYFDPSGISYSTIGFFQDKYSIIREYAPGEKLTVVR